MVRIYCLKIDSRIFYIGKTKQYLAQRLAGHLSNTKGIKELPEWLKKLIVIETIEECVLNNAAARERHWIYHHAKLGLQLINKNCINSFSKAPKHQYKILTSNEADFIKYKIGYSAIAPELQTNPETIRIAVIKKRMKKEYYNKIFSGDRLLYFNTLLANCN